MEILEINIFDFNRGDNKTFEEVFVYYFKPLQYFAMQILHTEDEAEDVVKTTFVKLWSIRENFVTSEKIKAFLFITTRNACLNRLRDLNVRNQAKGTILKLEEAQLDNKDLLTKMIAAELMSNIYSEIERLPKKRKQIFKLAYIEGFTNKEIAQLLKIAVYTVKEHKQEGLRRLRKIFSVYKLT